MAFCCVNTTRAPAIAIVLLSHMYLGASNNVHLPETACSEPLYTGGEKSCLAALEWNPSGRSLGNVFSVL